MLQKIAKDVLLNWKLSKAQLQAAIVGKNINIEGIARFKHDQITVQVLNVKRCE